MKNTLKLLLTVTAVVYGLTSIGISQVTPSADAYTNSATAATNYGAAITLGVREGSSLYSFPQNRTF